MTRRQCFPILGALLALSSLAGACDSGDGEPPAVEAPAAGEGAVEGLSRDQISKQVQPLTPEQAEQLGMEDTTVRADSSGGSSLSPVIPGTPPPVSVDSTAPSGRRAPGVTPPRP